MMPGDNKITEDVLERFKPLFEPKTVAVVGVSAKTMALPNVFIRRLREFGYRGEIYPIHPTAGEIDGLKAYRSLGDTPRAPSVRASSAPTAWASTVRAEA
jgi:acyl-CoA synthetase (NDP forming)